MRTRTLLAALLLPCAFAVQAHEDATVFHAFRLELDAGDSRAAESTASWDLDGWVGGDNHKLWLKSEGEVGDHATEHSETWALYSYNLDTFWDVQAGVRYDNRPASTGYFVTGFTGLAPYFVETEAHLFVSDDGDVSARLHIERDWLLTQKLILQPYFEVNAYAQDVKALEVGSGLSDAGFGLQLRYEITRQFAPYVQWSAGRLFGETADIATRQGEHRSDTVVTAGVRLLF